MSEILNNPMILDETGAMIYQELRRQNGYMSIIAERAKQEIYTSMAGISRFIRTNDVETNRKTFPVGDQIIVPWKDLDDSNHNTDDTAYQVAWDIVHHGIVTLEDGSQVPGMYLQMHKCSAYELPFDPGQGVMILDEDLPAGTYNISATNSESFSFTLNYGAPNGSMLLCTVFEDVPTLFVLSISNNIVIDVIDMVYVVYGEELGTNLCNMDPNIPLADGKANSQTRVAYGYNRWSTSYIRQYLNSVGTTMTWFVQKDTFSSPPHETNLLQSHGFLSGFNYDFLNVIKPIKVTTALNLADGNGSLTTEDTFDTFFLPSIDQLNFNVDPEYVGIEMEAFDYWKKALGSQTPIIIGSSAAQLFDALKIPSLKGGPAQNVWLRSSNLVDQGHSSAISSMGYIDLFPSKSLFFFSPVCVVC